MPSKQNSWARIPYSKRQAFRLMIFERDGWRCRIRGPHCTGRAEELDHIFPRRDGGAVLDPDNCRAVCAVCHDERRPGTEKTIAGPSREW